ncbi:MAG: SDR family oxidoreductase [Balneolaceae bacterium]
MQKHIVITGASRGIGFETARNLAMAGHKVTAIARSEDELNKLKNLYPDLISILPLDLTLSSSLDKFVHYLSENKINVDGLINNAGLLINKPFPELTDEDWDRQISVNLMIPVKLTRKILKFFSEESHIVNIGSMGGFQGSSKFPGLTGYSVAKGALTILTECLSTELTDQKISCNCLCLGAVQTEMLNEAFPGLEAPVQPQQMGKYIADFVINGHGFYNGKILPVALDNPG